MEATMTTKDTLEARVREMPLLQRLESCERRIGNMCSEGRPPRMRIPVHHDDDDFFICATMRDARHTFEQAKAALEEVYGFFDNPLACSEPLQAVLRRVRDTLAAMAAPQ